MKLLNTTHRFAVALRHGFIMTGALVAALAVQAQQSDPTKGYEHHASKAGETASCLKEIAQMNTASIKAGQLASQKAQSPELKRFAEQLEKDHQKAQDKLETIAKKHEVALPTALDPKCQEEMSKLQGLSGAEFDKEFAKSAVQGHAMAISKLQKASVDAKDSDLAQYSKDMVSHMKRHQEKAREVAKAVGLDQTTIAALETQPPEGVGTSGASSQTERGTVTPQSTDTPERKDSPREP
jgi:putative membrane protein